jgi:S1-C subfamily serine protease
MSIYQVPSPEHHETDPSESITSQASPARARQLIFGFLLVFALLAGIVGGGLGARALWPAPISVAAPVVSLQPVAQVAQTAPSLNIAGPVYRSVGPAVVEVIVSSGGQRRFGRSGSGSGFVISKDGHILTNYHVVAGASSVQVRFGSGEQRDAQVVGTDRGNDLALLKVDLPANTPVAPLGDSDQIQVGDPAIAIGSPFGLEATVTQGIISAVHRDWQPQGSTLQRDLIQTDAPINPGNSGGALLNANGEVIGITTAIESPVSGSVGVGFAVPINRAKQLLPQLESGARLEPVWLGISGQELTPDVAQAQGLSVQRGVLVEEVVNGSPAAAAGLQSGDVISAIDGSTITTFAQLSTQLASHKAGDTIKITVIRGGQEHQLTATLQTRPAETG